MLVESSVEVGVGSWRVLSGAAEVGVADGSGAGAVLDTGAGLPVPAVVVLGVSGRMYR